MKLLLRNKTKQVRLRFFDVGDTVSVSQDEFPNMPYNFAGLVTTSYNGMVEVWWLGKATNFNPSRRSFLKHFAREFSNFIPCRAVLTEKVVEVFDDRIIEPIEENPF
jgi:hypothetical protein